MRHIKARFRVFLLVVVTAATGCGDGTSEPTPEPNRAPVPAASIPLQTITVGETASVNLSPAFSDPDGDALQYSAASSDAGVATVSVAGTSATVTAIAAGSTSVTVTASDPSGLTATQSFSVTVEARPTGVRLATESVSVPEGGVAVLQISIDPAPETSVVVGYSFGADSDPGTDDADEVDFADDGGGSVRIEAGASSASIEIAISDDDDIEPTREIFTVALDAPSSESGFVLSERNVARVTIEEGICDRTPQVQDEIMKDIGSVDRCSEVTDQRLRGIGSVDLVDSGITALKTGDFDGLDNMTHLYLIGNALTTLPAGVFEGLARVVWLRVDGNKLSELPAGVFEGLSSLGFLDLSNNELAELPAGVFSGLPSLTQLLLHTNQLVELPEGVFARLPSLDLLELFSNRLQELPEGIFADLPQLASLVLDDNQLRALPGGIFDGLSSLQSLSLNDNRLSTLSENLFRGLSSLTSLWVQGNTLGELPGGVFGDLSALEELYLSGNQLTDLPGSMFAGLSSLLSLSLDGNPGAPFTLALEIRRVDSDDLMTPGPAEVTVSLAEGAPFAMSVGLSINGGHTSADVAVLIAGSTRTQSFAVSQAAGHTSTQITAGPAPKVPTRLMGIEVSLPDPLVLFGQASGTSPIANREMPWIQLREGGGEAWFLVTDHFLDSDGDDLVLRAVSNDPGVAMTSIDGSRIVVEASGRGATEVVVTATDPSGLSAWMSLPVTVRAPSPGSFDIDLILTGEAITESREAAFVNAVNHWMRILSRMELPDSPLPPGTQLGCGEAATEQRMDVVNDLVIVAAVQQTSQLGQAFGSPCRIRDESRKPLTGMLLVNPGALDWAEDRETEGAVRVAEQIILHEIGHILGIGTAWYSSIRGPEGADPHFTGSLATEAFDEAGGTSYTYGGKVPVELEYLSHWRQDNGVGESGFRWAFGKGELMTPSLSWLASSPPVIENPLSAITIQALADLGWTVDVSLAEPFALPGTGAVSAIGGEAARKIVLELGDDIMKGPIVVVDRNGRAVRILR